MIVHAGMAMMADRWPKSYKVLKSLATQCDRIHIALNGFEEVPWELKRDPYHVWHVGRNLGDGAKFYTKDEGYDLFLTCDDDLIYPDTYVKDIIDACDRYPEHVITFHGHNMRGKTDNFLKDMLYSHNKNGMRCLGGAKSDLPIRIIGTGVSAYPRELYRAALSHFQVGRNIGDLIMSKALEDAGIPRMGITHEGNYFKYVHPPKGTTIYETTTSHNQRMTEIWNGLGL